MDLSWEAKNKHKRQKLDILEGHSTPTERENMLSTDEKAVIRNKRSQTSKPVNQDVYKNSASAFDYRDPSFQNNKLNNKTSKARSSNGTSPAFLITALEELHRVEEEERSRQSREYLEREIEHLQRGVVSRDATIKKLRKELDEKDRILKSLPRELVVNWVVTHQMIARKHINKGILVE